MELWLVIDVICFAILLFSVFPNQLFPRESLEDLEAEFKDRFPGRCPRCSYNRWALENGHPLCERPHECPETRS